MSRRARIVGVVEYRGGDGPSVAIRTGPCEVEETTSDATISWHDGGTSGSAAMPLFDFRRYVASRAIEFIDPPGAA